MDPWSIVPARYTPDLRPVIGGGGRGRQGHGNAPLRRYTDSFTGLPVVAKLIQPLGMHGPSLAPGCFEHSKRVYREISLLSQLRHPNLVLLTDVLASAPLGMSSTYVLIFESLEMDLDTLFTEHVAQLLPLHHPKFILYEMLCGLAFMHASGVAHRDLKTRNIGTLNANTIKILDLGLARGESAFQQPPPPGASATNVICSSGFRAPEVPLLDDGAHTSPAIDVWSMGCIWADMLLHLRFRSPIPYIDPPPKLFTPSVHEPPADLVFLEADEGAVSLLVGIGATGQEDLTASLHMFQAAQPAATAGGGGSSSSSSSAPPPSLPHTVLSTSGERTTLAIHGELAARKAVQSGVWACYKQLRAEQLLGNRAAQVGDICKVLGVPSDEEAGLPSAGTPAGARARKILAGLRARLPQAPPRPLQAYFPYIAHIFPPEEAAQCFDLLARMLHFSPERRITALEALEHPFFSKKEGAPLWDAAAGGWSTARGVQEVVGVQQADKVAVLRALAAGEMGGGGGGGGGGGAARVAYSEPTPETVTDMLALLVAEYRARAEAQGAARSRTSSYSVSPPPGLGGEPGGGGME